MGAIFSYFTSSQPEVLPQIPEMTALSDEDIEVIKRTWEIPRAIPYDAGVNILLKYFAKYPKYQNYFEKFKDIPLSNLKSSPAFRAHAGRIIKVFDDTIQTLGTAQFESTMRNLWETTGENHFQRTIPIKAFADLKGVVIEVIAYCCYLTPEESKSWDNFFNNIYHILFNKMQNLADEKHKTST